MNGTNTIGESTKYTTSDLQSTHGSLRRELIDGELVAMAAPDLRHQRVTVRLLVVFWQYIAVHGGGEIFSAPADVVLSGTNVVQPDLFFVLNVQRYIFNENSVQGAPSLVIEVVSDSRVDRGRKRLLYANFGVPEYWVVDPDIDRVEVYKLAGSAYGKPEVFEAPERVTYGRLPGLDIELTALFAR